MSASRTIRRPTGQLVSRQYVEHHQTGEQRKREHGLLRGCLPGIRIDLVEQMARLLPSEGYP
jgi:hypothetical protein